MITMQDTNIGVRATTPPMASLTVDPAFNSPPPASPCQAVLVDGTPVLRVQLLYEDMRAALRATQVFDSLVKHLPLVGDLHFNLWRLDLLSVSGLREFVTSQIADADILLLSAHGQRALPGFVQFWLQQWLAVERSGPRALVLLLDAAGRGLCAASEVLLPLQAAARLNRVRVFSQFAEELDMDQGFAAEDPPYSAETTTSLLGVTYRRTEPNSHWGINEW